MKETFWRPMAERRSRSKYSTLADVTKAAKEYLQENHELGQVFVLKFDRRGPIKGRIYVRANDGLFRQHDTRWKQQER